MPWTECRLLCAMVVMQGLTSWSLLLLHGFRGQNSGLNLTLAWAFSLFYPLYVSSSFPFRLTEYFSLPCLVTGCFLLLLRPCFRNGNLQIYQSLNISECREGSLVTDRWLMCLVWHVKCRLDSAHITVILRLPLSLFALSHTVHPSHFLTRPTSSQRVALPPDQSAAWRQSNFHHCVSVFTLAGLFILFYLFVYPFHKQT